MKIHNSKMDKIIGANIHYARRNANISQTTLANALGVSFQQVQKYEYGANALKAATLFEVARLLGKPLVWFFEKHITRQFASTMTDVEKRIRVAAVRKMKARARGRK